MKLTRIHILAALLVLAICAIPFRRHVRRPFVAIVQRMRGMKTVEDRVAQYGSIVRVRLTPELSRAGCTYPPKAATFLALKDERVLEVWVTGDDDRLTFLKSYPILGASGHLGPKLREGDMQVPEGLYEIESLNPNSMFHLSIRLNYPNASDRAQGKWDGRDQLGSDIMIHGNTCSAGCLAMGDEAAEDLFILAAETGIHRVSIIVAPVDFRARSLPRDIHPAPDWTGELYAAIQSEMRPLRRGKALKAE